MQAAEAEADGGGGGTASPSTPKGAVQTFVADVGKSDWKGACALVDPQAQVDLIPLLHVNINAELDNFGQLKDCSASLAKHAPALRTALKGADPGTTTQKSATLATVSSPRGSWGTILAKKPGAKRWLISGVPRGN